MARIFLWLITIVVLFSRCNNRNEASSYKELLTKPPYLNLTDSIRHDSKNADLYYRRGILLRKNNNLQPALDDFRKAWELGKKEIYAVSVSSILLSQPDSAIGFINSALTQFPNSIALKLNLAAAFAGQEKTAEAERICDDIISQQPNQLDALEMKADLLEQKNDTTGSIKILEQAYRFAPFDEQLCYNLANKYAQTKNAKTIKLCDSLIQTDSSQPEPYYFKGVYYENVNNKSKAIVLFNEAMLHDYTFMDAYMDKGKILYEGRKYEEAINVFELALKISATYPDAYYWLGRCQEAVGQKEDAKLNYLRAYGLDKSFTEAKEAADRL
jgi:tetratricopeptide (TPR) repeat protein